MDIRKPLAVACTFLFILYLLYSKSRRRTFLLTVVYFLPLMDLLITPTSRGSFTVFDFISFYSVIFLIKDFRFTTNRNAVYFVIFLLFFGTLLFGTMESQFRSVSLVSYFQFFPVFIFSKALMEEINDDPAFTHVIIRAARVICLVSLVFLAMQLIVGLKFSLYPSLNTNTFTGGSARYPSFFNDPQKYAQYLSMSSFLFLIPTNHPKETPLKRNLFFLAAVVGLFLTGARAAFGGLVVGLAIVFLIGESKYRTVGIAGGLAGYLLIVLFGEYFPLFNREESASESFEFRNHIWQEALQIFRDNPVFGIGIGNYQSYVALYSPDQFWFLPENEIMYFDHPESGYLKMLTEFGAIPFFLLCLYVVIPFFSGLRSFFNQWTDNRVFYFIGALVGWMISYITVYSLSDRRVLIMVALHISLLILAGNNKLEELHEKDNE
ncbi:O-antigen ligase family protein [Paracnuella aquatica]|uniref:O-antigen ligase family protein n=1 Tax=Paracnuella aquatica TaxID=2268757 RepID=UPI000DEF4CD6|nr:O-antigen ligase family protein [Paracnuella aquatica]RPD47275.1 O-antigen ligase domain-containing protein [Paracnuella aquatica]